MFETRTARRPVLIAVKVTIRRSLPWIPPTSVEKSARTSSLALSRTVALRMFQSNARPAINSETTESQIAAEFSTGTSKHRLSAQAATSPRGRHDCEIPKMRQAMKDNCLVTAETAGWIALATLLAVLYDLVWRKRPRLRLRIRTWRDSTRLDLVFMNRGGSALSILKVVIQVFDGEKYPKIEWDGEPISVPPFGAQALRLETPSPASGSIMVETIPMGERWFALPDPGWVGHQPGRIERIWRRLLDWGSVPRGASQDLRGQKSPPTSDSPLKLK